jgi:hypothetical protein
MARSRRIVAYDLPAAVAALVEARARGVARVELASPPGAAAWMGVGYFHALVEQAAAAVPAVRVVGVMDCGRDPGYALEALRAGFAVVELDAPAPVFRRVADIARLRGARLGKPARRRAGAPHCADGSAGICQAPPMPRSRPRARR